MRPIHWILLSCLAVSASHFAALSPEPFAGERGHHRLLSPYQIPERHLVVPRVRHGDPTYSGGSDVAGYLEEVEELHATGTVARGTRHPFLSYSAAGLFAAFGRHVIFYYLVPLVCYLGSVWCVYRLGMRLFDETSGTLAALLAGLHPTIVLESLSFNSHAVSPLVNLLALGFFLKTLHEPRYWIALMGLLGIARLVRIENMVLAGVYPALGWALGRLFPDRVNVRFGRHFWTGVGFCFLITLPYHMTQYARFGNPLHPFDLASLLQGRPEDPKYTGHEGPFKMFALFFMTGSWLWPFLFTQGVRRAYGAGGDARLRTTALLAILGFWFAGFCLQAITDPSGIHVIFGIQIVAVLAGGGLALFGRGLRNGILLWCATYTLIAQILLIHACQFLYGEGHLLIWGLDLENVKRWLISLPIWKFGNP